MSLGLSPHCLTGGNDACTLCLAGLESKNDAWLGDGQQARFKENPKL